MSPTKIVHFWKSDSGFRGGGGAIAMHRLHSGLRQADLDSQILCQFKTTQSPYVQVLKPKTPVRIVEKLLQQITSRLGLNDIHRLSSFGVKQNQMYRHADLLHFHGTHGGFFNYLALPYLTKDKPAMLTLHDMWSVTGHCGYSFDCDRWKTGCGQCPYPATPPSIKRDATALEWKLKKWTYDRANLSLICPSKWLAKLASQSPLTNHLPIHHIPSGIDTETFQPLDHQLCRSELGIPRDKKVLMFASVQLNDTRKGGDLLVQALQNLPPVFKQETVLLVLGNGADNIASLVDIPVYDLGYLNHDHAKVVAYSAADLFLLPTRADNLPLVLQESMSCGTPMVSFEVGGVPELVRHGITGYLAQPENAADLTIQIVRLLENKTLRDQMSLQCRAIAEAEYSLALFTQRHIDLYRQVLKIKTDKLEKLPVLQ